MATLRKGDDLVQVESSQLQRGDSILVRPGERFPVDARVLVGETEVDESVVSGEPFPVAVKVAVRQQ